MKLLPLLIAAVLVVAALTACGGSSSATTPTPFGQTAVSWHLRSFPTGDTVQIWVDHGSPPCYDLEQPLVDESDRYVTIGMFIIPKDPDYKGPCQAYIQEEQVDVKLSKPIGDRHLDGCKAGDHPTPTPGIDCRAYLP